MKIYCSHSIKRFTKTSNYYNCLLCPAQWYGTDRVPLVIIGFTDPLEVSPDFAQAAPKDLTKKKFKRCDVCHDLVEKRKHILCRVKRFLDGITVGPAPVQVGRK